MGYYSTMPLPSHMTCLPHMQSGIQAGSDQACNTAALQGFPISSVVALKTAVIVSESAGFHARSVHGVDGRDQG